MGTRLAVRMNLGNGLPLNAAKGARYNEENLRNSRRNAIGRWCGLVLRDEESDDGFGLKLSP